MRVYHVTLPQFIDDLIRKGSIDPGCNRDLGQGYAHVMGAYPTYDQVSNYLGYDDRVCIYVLVIDVDKDLLPDPTEPQFNWLIYKGALPFRLARLDYLEVGAL